MYPTDVSPSLQDLSLFAAYEQAVFQSGEHTLSEILRYISDHSPSFSDLFNLHPTHNEQERLNAFVASTLMQHADEERLLRRCITWLLHPVGAHIMQEIIDLDLLGATRTEALMNTDLFTSSMLHSFLELPSVPTDTPDAAKIPLFHLLKSTWGRTQIKKLTWRSLHRDPEPNPHALADLDRWLKALMDPKLLNARATSGVDQGSSLMFYLMLGTCTPLPPSIEKNLRYSSGDEANAPLEPHEEDPNADLTETYDYFIRFSELLKDRQDPKTHEAGDTWLTQITTETLFSRASFGIHAHQSLFSLLMQYSRSYDPENRKSLVPPPKIVFSRWVHNHPQLHPNIYGSTPLELLHFFPEGFRYHRLLHDFYMAQFSAQNHHLLSQVDELFLRQHLTFFITHPTLFTLNRYYLLKRLPDDLIPALLSAHLQSFLGFFERNAFLSAYTGSWAPKELSYPQNVPLKFNLEYIFKLDNHYLAHKMAEQAGTVSNFWALVDPMKTNHELLLTRLKTITRLEPTLMASLDRSITQESLAQISATLACDPQASVAPTPTPPPAQALDALIDTLLTACVPIVSRIPIVEEDPVWPFMVGSSVVYFTYKKQTYSKPTFREEIHYPAPQSHEQFLSSLAYLCEHMNEEQIASLVIRLIVIPDLRCAFEHANYQLLRSITAQAWQTIFSTPNPSRFLDLFSLDHHYALTVLNPETVISLFRQLHQHPNLEQIFFLDDAYVLRTQAQHIFNTLTTLLATPSGDGFTYFMDRAYHWLSAHDDTLFRLITHDTLLDPLLPIVLASWDRCSPCIQEQASQLLACLDASDFAKALRSLSHEKELTRLLSLNEHQLYTMLNSDSLNSQLIIDIFKRCDATRRLILNDPKLSQQLDLRTLMQDIKTLALSDGGPEKACLVDLLSHEPDLFLDFSPEEQQCFYLTYLDGRTDASLLETLWRLNASILLHRFQLSWLSFDQMARIPESCWALDDDYLWRQCTPEHWAHLLFCSKPEQRAFLVSQGAHKATISEAQLQHTVKAQLQHTVLTADAPWLSLVLETPSLLDGMDAAFILALLKEDLFLIDNRVEGVVMPHRELLYSELLTHPKIYDTLSAPLINLYFLSIPLSALEKNDHRLMHLLTPESLHRVLNELLTSDETKRYTLRKFIEVLCVKYDHLLKCVESRSQDTHGSHARTSSQPRHELRSFLSVIFTYLHNESQRLNGGEYVYRTLLRECTPLLTIDPEFWSLQLQGETSILAAPFKDPFYFYYAQDRDYRDGRQNMYLHLFGGADGIVAKQETKALNGLEDWIRLRYACTEYMAYPRIHNILKGLLTGGEYDLLRRSLGSPSWIDLLDLLLQHQDIFEAKIIEAVLSIHDYQLLKKIAYDPAMLHHLLSHPERERFLNLDGGRLRHALPTQGTSTLCVGPITPSLSFFASEAHEHPDPSGTSCEQGADKEAKRLLK